MNVLTISILENLKLIFEIQTRSAKSINLGIVRKLIEYSHKMQVKVPFTPTGFNILVFEGKSVVSPAQRVRKSKRVIFSVRNQKSQLLSKIL